jgi:hypothetical protein
MRTANISLRPQPWHRTDSFLHPKLTTVIRIGEQDSGRAVPSPSDDRVLLATVVQGHSREPLSGERRTATVLSGGSPRRAIRQNGPAFYGMSFGGVRLNLCRAKYRSALSANQRGSRSPALAAWIMCFARIARPAAAYSWCRRARYSPALDAMRPQKHLREYLSPQGQMPRQRIA